LYTVVCVADSRSFVVLGVVLKTQINADNLEAGSPEKQLA
jgi:hypothetical protein